jgi:CheY-like chemotaxis protein
MATAVRLSARTDLSSWLIPVGREKDRSRTATADRPEERLNLEGLTILVIEDHDDSREMLRQLVASFAARVAVARNGQEALATASLRKPDLILCDLLMPVLDGFGFIERFRSHRKLKRVPVIAVSALGRDDDFKRTFEAGFDGHLVKPITYETMAAQLERIFPGRRS